MLPSGIESCAGHPRPGHRTIASSGGKASIALWSQLRIAELPSLLISINSRVSSCAYTETFRGARPMKHFALSALSLAFVGILATGVLAQNYQRTPLQQPIIPQQPLQLAPAKLACGPGNGDVVANPWIRNTGAQAVPQGAKISYTLTWSEIYGEGPTHQARQRYQEKISDSFVLASPLPSGGSISAPKYYRVHYTCTASIQRRG
jgi:hypothetical protein